MADKLKIYVILGSTRPERESEKVGRWVLGEMQKRAEFAAELIDLRDWPLPFYNEKAGPEDINGQYSVEIAKKWEAKIAAADGFIFITPEYNHGYTAVLKNALDYTYTSWNKKPASFVSYGGSAAGARSVEQLRLVCIELQLAPLHKGVHIPNIWDAWTDEGKLKNEETWSRRLEPLFDELSWWGRVLKTGREQRA